MTSLSCAAWRAKAWEAEVGETVGAAMLGCCHWVHVDRCGEREGGHVFRLKMEMEVSVEMPRDLRCWYDVPP